MAYRFDISPVRRRSVVVVAKENEPEIEVLSLVPFAAAPKIYFDNVILGSTAKRHVLIKNPTSRNIDLGFTRLPPEERGLNLNWYQENIQANGELLLELSWRPIEEGGWCDKIIIEGGGRIKKEVTITFKSIQAKKQKCVRKKTVPKFLVKRTKSPVKQWNKSPKKTVTEKLRTTPKLVKHEKNLYKTIESGIVDKIFTTPEKFDDSLEMDLSPKSSTFNKSSEILKDITYTSLMNSTVQTNLSPYYYYTSKKVSNSLETVKRNGKTLATNESSSTYIIDENSRTYDNFLLATTNTQKTSKYNLPQITKENSPTPNVRNTIILIKNSSNFLNHKLSPPELKNKDITLDQKIILEPVRKNMSTSDIKIFSTTDPLNASKPIFDPFMLSSKYYDYRWMDQQEGYFIKWLNVLLAPPKELNCNTEGIKLNPADLWQKCKNLANTNVPVANVFTPQSRLNSVRKAGMNLYKSVSVTQVLSNVANVIDSDKLKIRSDRNVHLDLSLQEGIMHLFLSYNPLWLRIGLETIYKTKININSNSDVYGLSNFILNRFFKDPQLIKKYGSIYSSKYTTEIKRLILKRFFSLVYFLDQAKMQHLIAHDPCLFCKNSNFKESRDILINFTKETISAVGDITKDLKKCGYVVSYIQTYINEFDYTVTCLGSDLRDGIRLARVIEIILLVDDITTKLRVPPISRLQKLHNTKLVFDTLNNAGFQILYDICPKDIVEGCREKTLSFLWQIICNFETPRFVKAASVIQQWWRSLRIIITRRISRRTFKKREQAAITIQRAFRRKHFIAKLEDFIYKLQLYLSIKRQEEDKTRLAAIIKLQAYIRTYLTRKYYLKLKSYVIIIQCKFRANILMKRQREYFLKLKKTVNSIENHFISRKMMRRELANFERIKYATITIQHHIRAFLLMQKQHRYFIELKQVTIFIQRRFRANQLMKSKQKEYQIIKRAIIVIQTHFRAHLLMKIQREEFRNLKRAAITIQNYYRAKKLMKEQRNKYINMTNASIVIQQRFRAHIMMHHQRALFRIRKQAIICIQRHFRAHLLMKSQRRHYETIKISVIVIQKRFRAYLLMKITRSTFLILKQATLSIQRHYRAQQLMKLEKIKFNALKNYVIIIQKRFRATMLMRKERASYVELKETVVWIQRYFRSRQLMKKDMCNYKKLKTIVNLQAASRRYLLKQNLEGIKIRFYEERKRTCAATKIQAIWKGYVTRKENPKMDEIRQRVQRANSTATLETTLGYRRSKAIASLNDNLPIFSVINILTEIDFITRTCRDSCKMMSFFMPDYLYTVLSSINRSLPEMQVAIQATAILINFCKCSFTIDKVWQPDYMENILSLMLIWCDKESLLFPYLCTLIWLLCHNENYKNVIVNMQYFKRDIHKMHSLCTRKAKMYKNNMKSSVFSPCALQLPTTKAYWNYTRGNKPYTFTNSLHALENVINICSDSINLFKK